MNDIIIWILTISLEYKLNQKYIKFAENIVNVLEGSGCKIKIVIDFNHN
jgi:hypothetical protein